MLKDCLNSIFALDYPKSKFEVIVVDGESTDGTMDLRNHFPKARFITESRQGLATARNMGARRARGSIIAYTDDDCIVDPQWLKSLVSGFHFSTSTIGVGGPVYPANPRIIPEKFLVKAALGLFDDGDHTKLADRGIITSNCAFKREAFDVAKFDDRLGVTRRGRLLLSGEDVDFNQVLAKAGYHLLYAPHAKVYHQIAIQRLRATYIIRHALHNSISYARMQIKEWKESRIKATRYIVGRTAQALFSFLRKRTFTACYSLVLSMAAFLVCLTFLDEFAFR